MPTVLHKRRQQILTLLEPYHLQLKTLPTMVEIAKGEVTVEDVGYVDIEDLLGRAPVTHNEGLMSKRISRKVVMVTGVGGSLGSELCRQLLRLGPIKLILFENIEYSLYVLDKELQQLRAMLGLDGLVSIVPVLGTVFNKNRIINVCLGCHAEAFNKPVSLAKQNPGEAPNNVFGTIYAA